MTDEEITMKQLKDLVAEFISERSWEPYHSPKNLAGSIAIEAAELMEIFQWEEVDAEHARTNKHLMAQISDEVADILIYVLSLANSLNMDITDAVKHKLRKNREKYPT